MMQPLVLTLKFDEASFDRLDALRQAHFPARLNKLKAHLTLFHALPGAEVELVREVLTEICARTAAMELGFPGVFSLGKGVAVSVECAALEDFRRELLGRFGGFLTAQDAQRMRPHVTVQNKVTPEAARALLGRLSRDWEAFEGAGLGVSLWEYRGGPWGLVEEFGFGGESIRSQKKPSACADECTSQQRRLVFAGFRQRRLTLFSGCESVRRH